MSHLEPLLTAEQIAARIQTLAQEIRARHGDHTLWLIGELKGSFLFHADLTRALHDLDVRIDFLGVSSYEGTSTTGVVRVTHDLKHDIAGDHVILVEDIVDTGLTMRYLLDNLSTRQPASLEVATLLDKPSRRKVELVPDYIGFSIPDAFVVGYGLDLDQRFRNLPDVCVYVP